MIIFLLIGIVLGAVAVVFVLQNTDVVTVTFLTYHIDGSLALILFLAIASGIAITLLILLPSFIVDLFALRKLRKQNKELEAEVNSVRQNLASEPAPASQGEPIVIV